MTAASSVAVGGKKKDPAPNGVHSEKMKQHIPSQTWQDCLSTARYSPWERQRPEGPASHPACAVHLPLSCTTTTPRQRGSHAVRRREGTDLLCRSHVLPALKSTRRSCPSANRTACGWWDQLWLLQVWKLCQLVRWAQQLKNKHKDGFDSQELQIHHSARPHLQTCASQKL